MKPTPSVKLFFALTVGATPPGSRGAWIWHAEADSIFRMAERLSDGSVPMRQVLAGKEISLFTDRMTCVSCLNLQDQSKPCGLMYLMKYFDIRKISIQTEGRLASGELRHFYSSGVESHAADGKFVSELLDDGSFVW